MRRLLFIILIALPIAVLAQNRMTQAQYIAKYKDVAIEHMRVYKIPASIKLAQAIIESGNGNSALAQKENNHFGIKAGKNWQGEVAYYDDDAKGEPFRKYRSAEDSFIDHSKLLSTASRYKELFKLEITDYKGWAYGLKKAGYATLPTYAEVLIATVESNNLQQYDVMTSGSERPHKTFTIAYANSSDRHGRQLGATNGVRYVVSKRGDTFEAIARDEKIRVKKLLKFNDLQSGVSLNEGVAVYIEEKQTTSVRHSHIAKAGETTHSISQEYGVKMKSLERRNPALKNRKPMVGEEILLR